MRKTRVFLGVAFAATLLNGCGDDKNSSDVMPVDGRDMIEPAVANEEVYTGRAADGYLRDAFVWLDIDDDKTFDEGEEPSVFTVAGGHFTMDLREMNDARRAANERIIDPREYPLMLLAIPGRTVDEGSGQDNNTVNRGFFMSAPAGTNFISPLTTMVKTKMDLMTFFDKTEAEKRDNAHNATRKIIGKGVNLLENYVVADDAELSLYASIVTQLIKNYTTDEIDQKLRDENFAAYNKEEMEVIARNALNLMPDAITEISRLVENGFDYDEIGLPMLDLNFIDINLSDPFVLIAETTNKNEALVAGEKYESGARTLSSRVDYFYSSVGVPLGLTVDGYREFAPYKLPWFASNTGISIELEQQWVADDRVEQRYTFKWENNRFSGVTLDSIHHYDNDKTLSKKQAQEDTASDGLDYVFDGLYEAESFYTFIDDQLTQINYSHREQDFIVKYAYNESNFLSQIDVYQVDQAGAETKVGYLVFDYNTTKKVGGEDISIDRTIDEFHVGSEEDVLARHYEYFDKTIFVNCESESESESESQSTCNTDSDGDNKNDSEAKTVLSHIFITDHVADPNDKYTRWDVDYISAIDLLEAGQREGLSEDSAADLAAARKLINDDKLLELEGRLASFILKPATISGDKGRGAEYIINLYEYVRLSEYIFSDLTEE